MRDAGNNQALYVGSDFSTFSTSLSQYSSIYGGSLEAFQQYGGLTANLGATFSINNGPGDFGLDAENTLIFDNLGLTVVPEPGSAALLALAGLTLALRRRRSV